MLSVLKKLFARKPPPPPLQPTEAMDITQETETRIGTSAFESPEAQNEVDEIKRTIHDQVHRLHVLEWQADVVARRKPKPRENS